MESPAAASIIRLVRDRIFAALAASSFSVTRASAVAMQARRNTAAKKPSAISPMFAISSILRRNSL